MSRTKARVRDSLDRRYLTMDKRQILRTRNLQLMPAAPHRRGGKTSYAEWAYVIGIFQTLIYLHIPAMSSIDVLDVGCGAGILAIASEPLLGETGHYLGLDVQPDRIEYCSEHYPNSQFTFRTVGASNPLYNPSGAANAAWNVESPIHST